MYNVEQKQHAGKTGEAFYTTLEVCALWPEGERERPRVFYGTLMTCEDSVGIFYISKVTALLLGL